MKAVQSKVCCDLEATKARWSHFRESTNQAEMMRRDTDSADFPRETIPVSSMACVSLCIDLCPSYLRLGGGGEESSSYSLVTIQENITPSMSPLLESPVWRTESGRACLHQSGHLEVMPKGHGLPRSATSSVGGSVVRSCMNGSSFGLLVTFQPRLSPKPGVSPW